MSERLFVDHLANEIRRVDGGHSLGAGALAEALLPFLAEHDRQVAERAWDEGYEAAAGFHEGREKGHWENDFPIKGMRTWRPDPAPTSPYRAVKGEQK